MASKIVVPDLGESITEATVLRWLKKEGDTVALGEVLLELETDKVNVEVGSEHVGVLIGITHGDGSDVKVGDELGVIEEGAIAAEMPGRAAEKPATKNPPKIAEPVAEKPVPEKPVVSVAHDDPAIFAPPPPELSKAVPEPVAPKPPAAPEPPRPAPVRETKPPLPVSPPQSGASREERIPMSRRRRTIGERLVEAKQSTAMLTTFNEIDMSKVMDLRRRFKETFSDRHRVGLGIMPFFVKAAVGALKAHPMLNAEIRGNEIILKHFYDIGIAIDVGEGLVVPTLRNAESMTFAAIEGGIREYARKAREGELAIGDLRGGSFTITNGGVFGSLLSTPILNPPQVGILGLHKIQERAVVVEGQIVARPMMYTALSYDHRLVDGREAVHFLVTIKEFIENPEELLLEG